MQPDRIERCASHGREAGSTGRWSNVRGKGGVCEGGVRALKRRKRERLRNYSLLFFRPFFGMILSITTD